MGCEFLHLEIVMWNVLYIYLYNIIFMYRYNIYIPIFAETGWVVFRTHCTAVFVTPDVKNGRNNQKVPEKLILLRAVLVSQVNPTSPPSTRKSSTAANAFEAKQQFGYFILFFIFLFISVQMAIIVLYVYCQQVFLIR